MGQEHRKYTMGRTKTAAERRPAAVGLTRRPQPASVGERFDYRVQRCWLSAVGRAPLLPVRSRGLARASSWTAKAISKPRYAARRLLNSMLSTAAAATCTTSSLTGQELPRTSTEFRTTARSVHLFRRPRRAGSQQNDGSRDASHPAGAPGAYTHRMSQIGVALPPRPNPRPADRA